MRNIHCVIRARRVDDGSWWYVSGATEKPEIDSTEIEMSNSFKAALMLRRMTEEHQEDFLASARGMEQYDPFTWEILEV